MAPAYTDYDLVLRLEGKKGKHDIHMASGCMEWMPGETVKKNYAFDLPAEVSRGNYHLKFRLADPSLENRTVLLGVAEALEDDDHFISIGKVRVR